MQRAHAPDAMQTPDVQQSVSPPQASCALLGTVGSAGHAMYKLCSSLSLYMAALCRWSTSTPLPCLERKL